MWMGCGVGLFLRSDQTLSVAEVGEGSASDDVEDSRGVGEPNGVEGSGCSGQSIDGGEVGCGLEDLAKYLWWEVYDGHCDIDPFQAADINLVMGIWACDRGFTSGNECEE